MYKLPEVVMKALALVIALFAMMMSGSAKAAQVCGMVIAVQANESKVAITIETKGGAKVAVSLDNEFSGTASNTRQSSNTNMINLATAAMNNPGSLDFCANTSNEGRIVAASIVNRFKIKN